MINPKRKKMIAAVLCAAIAAASLGCASNAGSTSNGAAVGNTGSVSAAENTGGDAAAGNAGSVADAEENTSGEENAEATRGEETAEATRGEETAEATSAEKPEESAVTAETKDSGAEEALYEEREVPVFDGNLTEKTVKLRFYSEAPHVAYMDIGDYFDLLLGGGLQCEPQGEGRYLLTNRSGATAEVDTVKGVMRIEDLPSFENYYDAAQKGEMSSFKDSDAPYLRLREVVYLDDPAPVEFDFAGCGIKLYGEEAAAGAQTDETPAGFQEDEAPAGAQTDETPAGAQTDETPAAAQTDAAGPQTGDSSAATQTDAAAAVWFPVSILGTFLSDIAQNTVTFNGEKLYICRQKDGHSQDGRYFDTEYINGVTNGEARADDLASYTYGELCFIFRYMYGYPGRAALDTRILREQGFDAALEAAGEEGRAFREKLRSTDFGEFWAGMYEIGQHALEDGHNYTELVMDLGDPEMMEKRKKFNEYMNSVIDGIPSGDFSRNLMMTNYLINAERAQLYADGPYYRSGDTEVICFSSFFVDGEGWKNYYENGGEMPADTLGVVAKGLQTAQESGDVRNILFDVSTNTGGNSDVVMGILSLISGKEYLSGYNELSKQRFRIYFDVDRNLDGVFDEKDKEVSYDFNYAALTSSGSFSCGNFFPFLVREAGGVLIGETSGGGSCSVQVADLSEGFEFYISGYKFKLMDDAGDDLEIGAVPDIELEVGMKDTVNDITGEKQTVKDYSAFADLDGICGKVSEWYTAN